MGEDAEANLRSALEEMASALDACAQRLADARERIERLRATVPGETDWVAVVSAEPRPLVVEAVTEVLGHLNRAGNRLRCAEARVLHDGGLPMETIAGLFGVTRQRISALLRSRGRAGDSAPEGPPSGG